MTYNCRNLLVNLSREEELIEKAHSRQINRISFLLHKILVRSTQQCTKALHSHEGSTHTHFSLGYVDSYIAPKDMIVGSHRRGRVKNSQNRSTNSHRRSMYTLRLSNIYRVHSLESRWRGHSHQIRKSFLRLLDSSSTSRDSYVI